MPSAIDLAVATGVFFLTVTFIISLVINYLGGFVGIVQSSELRTAAFDAFSTMFSSKGLPSDWDTKNFTPLRIGLMEDLHRVPVNILDTGGSGISNQTVNFTIVFDNNCLNRTHQNTIRIYNLSNSEQQYSLYNTTYCGSTSYINRTDLAVNVSIVPNSLDTLYVYSSPDRGINATGYKPISFPPVQVTYNATVFPATELTTISWSKINALRSIPIAEAIESFSNTYTFQIEVDST